VPRAFLLFVSRKLRDGSVTWDCRGLYYPHVRADRIMLNANARNPNARIEPL